MPTYRLIFFAVSDVGQRPLSVVYLIVLLIQSNIYNCLLFYSLEFVMTIGGKYNSYAGR